MTLLDQALPHYDARERHSVRIHAPAARVYAAVRSLDFGASPLVRALFAFRALPAALTRRGTSRRRRPPELTLDAMLRGGFILLGDRPGEELVLGLIGRFWTASGDPVHTDAAGYHAFDQPGYAKAVIGFALSEQCGGMTRLTTETRIHCLDRASLRLFRLYWLFIRPFSGAIRRAMLRTVKRRAEQTTP